MRWEVTLRDPFELLPDLVLRDFGDSGYTRSMVQQTQAPNFLAAGNPVIFGTLSPARYLWGLAADLSEPAALMFEAIVLEQDRRYSAAQDGHWLLIDELEYLPPELSLARDLVPGSELSVGGLSTGFGLFKVKLQVAEQYKTQRGRGSSGNVKLIQFTAVEV
jgi:hypothetical protein